MHVDQASCASALVGRVLVALDRVAMGWQETVLPIRSGIKDRRDRPQE